MNQPTERPPLVKRVRAVRGEMMREAIVDAALAEFAERGYHQTSMTHVATRLGVRHSLIYYYFDSKRVLLEHVTQHAMARLFGIFADLSQGPITSPEEFRNLISSLGAASMETICEDPRLSRLLILLSTAVDLEMTQQFNEWYDAGRNAVAVLLRSGIDAGWVRADISVEGVADAMAAMPLGLLMRHGSQPDRALLTDRIETFADMLYFAIDPRRAA